MLTTNTNFDTAHALDYKTPMYLIHFDGEATDFCNHEPGTPDNALKQYLVSVSGRSQTVTPEEGKATIGDFTFELLDYNDEITALIATDTYYLHRKKTTLRYGYLGMDEADMLSVTGWITGMKLSSNGLKYVFTMTDPKKWMQREIFRGSEDTAVTVQGNPIDIFLRCLTSTGAGTNGDYDWYAEENGLALDDDFINVAGIEAVRDDWYPGDSHRISITVNERIKAIDFFQTEIFKLLNIYPVVDGDGKVNIKPVKPPLAAIDKVQSFDEDSFRGLPRLDMNLGSLANEVSFHYDHDGDDYLSEEFYIDSTSVANRGPGKKAIKIESKGLHTSLSPASLGSRALYVMERRKTSIFGRFATPPIAITGDCHFSRMISEAGDVVPVTHSKIPDIEAGTRGISAKRMEIIGLDITWPSVKSGGGVKVKLLDTGFDKGIYQVISPSMTITVVTNRTHFTVSAADATKYANFTAPEVQVCMAHMRQRVTNITLSSVNGSTGAIVCDDPGLDLQVGWIVLFADYDDCTAEQKLYGFIADTSNNLGAADDDAHLICP
jgi:hypothetical protein